MTLTFPFSTSSFADVLRYTSIKLKLSDNAEYSGLGNGQIIVANLAPRYWMADISLINMPQADAMQVQALIEAMDGGLEDFYLYDPRCAYPQSDPDGSGLDTYVPRIKTLQSNNKEMVIKQLPVGYVLKAGDMMAFDYGSSGEYRALHRFVRTVTANGSGESLVELRPHIAPGAAVEAAITLIKPAARMKIIPGSFEEGEARQMMTTGISFKARQVP